jgi:hypothetical protein
MRSHPTKCVFCGSPDVTGEHIFSKWTHKFLSPRGKAKASFEFGRWYHDRSDTTIGKLPGQMRDWKVKCVCGSCNNGWMRRIENRARPLIIPLIKGDDTRLSPSDQSIIASWCILKAIVGGYDTENGPRVHYKQRQYFRKHGIPPVRGWGVWIGHYIRHKWVPEWVAVPFLLLPNGAVNKLPKRDATYFNSCASTQVIGKLFVHVIHTPMPDYVTIDRFSLPDKGTLFRIWPPAGSSFKWPDRALTEKDADTAADTVAARMREAERREFASLPAAATTAWRARPPARRIGSQRVSLGRG